MTKWRTFWQNYRIIKITNDDDLLYQVGLTVNGKPISSEQFSTIITDTQVVLQLNKSDKLLDVCCGNGIITFELSKLVEIVKGIDISKAFIDNALKYKSSINIEYIHLDALKINERLPNMKFDKIFMYGALAYFNYNEVDILFQKFNELILQSGKILIGNVLDKKRKYNFYNTPKRKLSYFINTKLLQKDPAVGRWWSEKELMELAEKNNFDISFIEENSILHTSHYRYDILLIKKNCP
jgi:cyclopropane fatty-acyl-phospholipid synthase-like methyltransferase